MKRILFLNLFIILYINCFSQVEEVKNIRAQIDSLDVFFGEGEIEKSIGFGLNLIEKEENRDKNSKYLLEIFYTMGNVMIAQNDLDHALDFFKKGFELVENSKEIPSEKDLYWKEKNRTGIAEIYARQGKFVESAELFRQSLPYAEKAEKRHMILNINDFLANISFTLGDTIACLDHLEKALLESDFLKRRNQQVSIRAKLFDLYNDMKQEEKALKFLTDARQLYAEHQEILSPPYLSIVDAITGDFFLQKGVPDSSYFYFKRSFNLLSSVAPPEYVINNSITIGLAESLIQLGRYKEGIELANKYLEASIESGFHEGLIDGKRVLSIAYEKTNRYKTALKYYKEYNEIVDSIMKEKNIVEVTRLHSKAEFDIEREVSAKQEEVLRAEASANRNLAGGIGALALAFLGFFWNARRQNKIIAQKNNQLESLNHTKDRIFAIIGHDLRKPAISFRGISKVINYLLDNKDYDRLQKVGVEVERDALSLYKLTDNLLSWALMQKDVMPHNPSEVSVAAIAEETIQVFSRVAEEKNITLTSKIPANLRVFADPNAVATIIRNLTDNALKYTPEGGSVTINAVDSPEGAKIIIEDTGVGIEKDKINDIFLLQKDKSERGTAGEKGTGIGMHLIHELVKINQGEVQVESTVGKGTKVVVMLPRQRLAAA